ncbi:hypothetical protein [Paraburkholderia fungorum]|uniref:hypothetical protein n=1 Tax=Paraburkholderia fungorum TaxID=134537 RepID=UPI003D6A8C44
MSCVIAKWPDLRHLAGSGAQVRKIWSTPLRKMSRKEEYEWLHDIADKALPVVRDAFLEAVEQVRGTAKESELRAAIATGNVEAVMRVLDIDAAMSARTIGQGRPAAGGRVHHGRPRRAGEDDPEPASR